MLQGFYPSYSEGSLHPQCEKILSESVNSNSKPLVESTPEEARADFLPLSWLGTADGAVIISEVIIHQKDYDLRIHIHTPRTDTIFPILVFFHGGGFVLGKVEEFDPFCSQVAAKTNCIVVSVDYRLAPENKFPAAIDDAMTAVDWIRKNASAISGDPSRIAVAGDSAGANLAAVVMNKLKDRNEMYLTHSILICPWINLACTDNLSYTRFGKGTWLSAANIKWYRNHYLQNEEQSLLPDVSPALFENPAGLPPTFILAAEFDVLHSEAIDYANRLAEAGIDVEIKTYKGMLHDFVVLPGVFDSATEAIEDISASLRKHFYP